MNPDSHQDELDLRIKTKFYIKGYNDQTDQKELPPFLTNPTYWYQRKHEDNHFDIDKLEDLSDSEVQNKDTSKHIAEIRV